MNEVGQDQAAFFSAQVTAEKRKWYQPRLGFHAWLKKFLPEPIILLLYALLVGIIGGFGAVGFRRLIALFKSLFFTDVKGAFAPLGHFDVFLLPVIGLFIVSFMVQYLAPEAKGHGVPEVMAAIAEEGSIIRPRVVVIKAVSSALCIGSGGSVGREGPIVQIGSAFGSSLGAYLGLPERYLRLLVGCGAGAGIAATFNAPIGGVMFATEVILNSFTLQNFTAVVISCVAAAGIGRIFFGNHATLTATVPVSSPHFSYYFIYILVGLLAGLWGFVYIRVLYKIEDWFNAIPWPFWSKAILGGVIVGGIGVAFPQVFGVGYTWVNAAISNHIGLTMMFVLLILKLLVTSVTIGAGGSGGVFSPGLYQGSMLGGVIGLLVVQIFPHSGLNPGMLAAIAMAGVFAGSAHAPVTSIIMLFEMTGDYKIILPIMIVSVLAATVTTTMSKETIYTLKLVRRGLDFYRLRQPDRMKAITVGDALATEHLALDANLTVRQAWKRFAETNAWFAHVRDEKGVVMGSVARAQVLETMNQTDGQDTIKMEELLPKTIHRIDEQATLAEALDKMHTLDVTYLLVVRKQNPIGVIGSSDIIHAYKEE
ncbi:chloride channel protein [Alicyclobacillus sp. SO9]|uniref:chloride channel protein n=1 Tax=Alicyclobacillus sp. SO9 TaxID=2665646 RepID=UPI001E4C3B0F|nr:chloride channel protein [Alicyclobacillus sp. SO9]